jgi:hypothetical protein
MGGDRFCPDSDCHSEPQLREQGGLCFLAGRRLKPGHPECPRFSSRAEGSQSARVYGRGLILSRLGLSFRAAVCASGEDSASSRADASIPVILSARAFLRGPKDLSLHLSIGEGRFRREFASQRKLAGASVNAARRSPPPSPGGVKPYETL